MSEEKTFFRTCPACGRKFEVHLVSKTKVGEDETIVKYDKVPSGTEEEAWLAQPGMVRPGWAVLDESIPAVVSAEDFRYRYRCRHCGHEWSEVHEKVGKGTAAGYTGD